MVSQYGGNYALISSVIDCENSSWSVDPLPHNNVSWGFAQFTPATWKDFGHGEIMNPYSQIEVMVKMFNMGLSKRWDCAKILE